MSDLRPGDAAIAGRLTIVYNGRIFTENCFATFGDRRMRLSAGGIVFLRIPMGWTSLNLLECKDTSMQHIQIKGAHFFARGDGSVSDFGDVAIAWDAPGGFKATSMFGLIGGAIDAAFDDGAAMVEVKGPVAEVRDAFHRHTGSADRWVVQQLSQPATRVAPVPRDDGEAGARVPRGFFCTSAVRRGRTVNLCEREIAACERVRGAWAGSSAPCVAAETAWCYAARTQLLCSQTKKACETVKEITPAGDPCGEQY